MRLPLTAAENVALAAAPDPAELAAVAAVTGLDNLIADLPDGWGTPLDRTVPGGSDLSGGQWQRIALARAVVASRRGAQVLVLDEPAAALDIRAEARLVERFVKVAAGTASLTISHRFSVVRGADRICVLDGGRITESGGHAELLARGGRYAAMFRAQARLHSDADPEEEAVDA